ncbi:MAG TPA: hypothetical protein VEY88_06310 [Archangium sp.]|nr:hypothetical protein [Archangium sp.]
MQKPIAQRNYEWADGRGHVKVTIFQPESDEKTGSFFCCYEIVGLDGSEPSRRVIRGVDTLHALQRTMQEVRVVLEPHRDRLRWFRDAELGFPQYLPYGFQAEIHAHFEQVIEREMVKLSKELGVDQHLRARSAKRRKPPKKN